MTRNYVWGFGFSFLLHLSVITVFFLLMRLMPYKSIETIIVDLSAVVVEKKVIIEEPPVTEELLPPPPVTVVQPKPVVKPAPQPVVVAETPAGAIDEGVTYTDATESSVAVPESGTGGISDTVGIPTWQPEIDRDLRTGYVKENFAYIQRLIKKNLVYPAQAKRTGIKGKVLVKFTINSDGTASGISVESSSGYDILDQAGIQAVYVSSPFPKPPVPAQIVVPIDFKLM